MSNPITYAFPKFPKVDGMPFVRFQATTFDRTAGAGIPGPTIYLPAPEKPSITDSADYDNIGFGAIDNAAVNAIQNSDSGFIASAKSQVADTLDKLKNTFLSVGGDGDLMRDVTNLGQFSDTAKAISSLGSRTAINPYIRTTFNGIKTRAFDFSFSLLPSNAEEAKSIKELCLAFRRFMYPLERDLMLEYPAIWDISFVKKRDNLTLDTAYPRIAKCYLTGVSNNLDLSAMYVDDSPLETSLTLNFVEEKALTRNDIDKLYNI